MKLLGIVIALTLLACLPKQKVTNEQKTVSEGTAEKSNAIEPLKDTVFKNSEGQKSTIPKPKVDTLKKSPASEKPLEEADASFQWDANRKLEKLLNHFGKNMPDYYGGAFINDKGNLVININGNLEEGKSKISTIIGTENILFQPAKHSLNELNRVMEVINKSFENPALKEYTKNIMTAASLEDKGYVEVGLKDNSPEKQKEFRKHIIDSPFLKFVKSGPVVLQ